MAHDEAWARRRADEAEKFDEAVERFKESIVGPQGPAGRDASWSDQKMLTLLIIVVGIFLLLSVRSEVNTHNIKIAQRDAKAAQLTLRQDDYHHCLQVVQIFERQNDVYRRLASIEATLVPTPGNERLGQRRAQVYLNAIVNLPAQPCGLKP